MILGEGPGRNPFPRHTGTRATTHLEHSDNGPQQGVEVLPVGDRVPCVRTEAEFAAKDVHPENAGEGWRWLEGLARTKLLPVHPASFPEQPRKMGGGRAGPILQM